jgi:hypothetical protein
VTKKFLYEFRVDAPAQKQGGAGVTETVGAYVGQVSSAEEWIEGSPDKVLGVDKRAPLCSEDQAAVLVDLALGKWTSSPASRSRISGESGISGSG